MYFLFPLKVYFEQHYFYGKLKEAMEEKKIKTFGLYFSNQKHSHLMLFFSPAGKMFTFVCELF